MDVMILAVFIHSSCLGVICEAKLQITGQRSPQFWIHDRYRNFHAPFRIAGHKVSGGNIQFQIPARAELVDAGMFQIASDNRTHMEVVCLALDFRQDAADASDNQIDLHTCRRSFLEFGNNFLIRDGIQLAGNTSFCSLGNFTVN